MMTDSLICFGDATGEFHFKDVSGGTGSFEYAVDGATFGSDTFFIGLGGVIIHWLFVMQTTVYPRSLIHQSMNLKS